MPGAPFSYTIGAGSQLTAALPNPGTYDVSLHGANGFFRHFAGSAHTALRVDAQIDENAGTLRLRLTPVRAGKHRRPVVVEIADAYGPGPARPPEQHKNDHDRHPRLGRLVRRRAHDAE